MSWEDQGRQEHGYFGHGTGTGTTKKVGGLADRIPWTAHASLMQIPRKDWHNGAATFDAQRLKRLQTAMGAWIGARSLSREKFEKRLVGGSASDAAIDGLRAAAEAVRTADTHKDLGEAATHLADAMQRIGLSKWPAFLRNAADRAEDHTPPAGDRVFAQLANGTATDASSGRPQSDAPSTPPGRYVADNPQQWAGQPSVGTGECVPLVQRATGAPLTRQWRPGAPIQGNTAIRPGTAIATFDENGRYGGHAAIYLGQDGNGVRVLDQWNIRHRDGTVSQHTPSIRTLPFNDPRHARVDRGESYGVVE